MAKDAHVSFSLELAGFPARIRCASKAFKGLAWVFGNTFDNMFRKEVLMTGAIDGEFCIRELRSEYVEFFNDLN